jgi:hypothetical protein
MRTAESEKSGRLADKLASGIGVIVAIPLAIIAFIVSTALPILVVVALFKGPGDTIDMVQAWIPGVGGESATCDGLDDWYAVTTEREDRVAASIESIQTGDVDDRIGMILIANDLDRATLEQLRSNPPPAAVTLNDMVSDMYALLARGSREAGNGNSSSLVTYESQYRQLSADAEEEYERVRGACD